MPFREGQEVRVKALLDRRHWERHASQSPGVPAISDIGLVVDVDGSSGRIIYAVECTDSHGAECWLTEFTEDELEPMPR